MNDAGFTFKVVRSLLQSGCLPWWMMPIPQAMINCNRAILDAPNPTLQLMSTPLNGVCQDVKRLVCLMAHSTVAMHPEFIQVKDGRATMRVFLKLSIDALRQGAGSGTKYTYMFARMHPAHPEPGRHVSEMPADALFRLGMRSQQDGIFLVAGWKGQDGAVLVGGNLAGNFDQSLARSDQLTAQIISRPSDVLKELCALRGLPLSGTVPELRARLLAMELGVAVRWGHRNVFRLLCGNLDGDDEDDRDGDNSDDSLYQPSGGATSSGSSSSDEAGSAWDSSDSESEGRMLVKDAQASIRMRGQGPAGRLEVLRPAGASGASSGWAPLHGSSNDGGGADDESPRGQRGGLRRGKTMLEPGPGQDHGVVVQPVPTVLPSPSSLFDGQAAAGARRLPPGPAPRAAAVQADIDNQALYELKRECEEKLFAIRALPPQHDPLPQASPEDGNTVLQHLLDIMSGQEPIEVTVNDELRAIASSNDGKGLVRGHHSGPSAALGEEPDFKARAAYKPGREKQGNKGTQGVRQSLAAKCWSHLWIKAVQVYTTIVWALDLACMWSVTGTSPRMCTRSKPQTPNKAAQPHVCGQFCPFCELEHCQSGQCYMVVSLGSIVEGMQASHALGKDPAHLTMRQVSQHVAVPVDLLIAMQEHAWQAPSSPSETAQCRCIQERTLLDAYHARGHTAPDDSAMPASAAAQPAEDAEGEQRAEQQMQGHRTTFVPDVGIQNTCEIPAHLLERSQKAMTHWRSCCLTPNVALLFQDRRAEPVHGAASGGGGAPPKRTTATTTTSATRRTIHPAQHPGTPPPASATSPPAPAGGSSPPRGPALGWAPTTTS